MVTHPPTSPAPAAPRHRVAGAAEFESACCLGRTCLHWRDDGELIDDDRDLVLQRLGMVDPQLHARQAA